MTTSATVPIENRRRSREGDARPHLAYIDGMRAVAALYVVLNHTLFRGAPPQALVLRLIGKVKVQGHFAVTAFIVISGFCLMLPVLRNGMRLREPVGQFFQRRFWRIGPPMYLACVVTLLVLLVPSVRATFGYARPPLHQVLAHLFLLQVIVPDGLFKSNGVLWSVSVEFIIYFFFPLLLLSTRRVGLGLTTLLFVIGGYVLTAFSCVPWFGGMTWQYLGAFALGTLACTIAYGDSPRLHGIRDRVPWYAITLVSLLTVAIPSVVIGWAKVVPAMTYLDLPIAMGAAAAMIGAARSDGGWVRRCLSCRPLVWIGAFSYSLYLIHYPLADLTQSCVLDRLSLGQWGEFFFTLLVFVPAAVLASFLFYLAFEAPFHRLARNIGRAKSKAVN